MDDDGSRQIFQNDGFLMSYVLPRSQNIRLFSPDSFGTMLRCKAS